MGERHAVYQNGCGLALWTGLSKINQSLYVLISFLNIQWWPRTCPIGIHNFYF
jgi:hypothetical protein